MLSAAELSLLGRLDLGYRRATTGLYAGERRSAHAARSPEFADFRAYVPGDDFRQIDWRAFARLDPAALGAAFAFVGAIAMLALVPAKLRSERP